MEKSSTAKRVLFLTPDYPMWDGGVSVLADKFASFFCRHGHSVTVATPFQLTQDRAFDARQSHRILRLKNVKDRYLKYHYAHWKLRHLLGSEAFHHIVCLTWHPFANAALVIRGGKFDGDGQWQRFSGEPLATTLLETAHASGISSGRSCGVLQQ
jgi:hypothetical protein